MELNKNVRLSMLLAISVVLALVESTIPFFSGQIPGLKLGLANTIVLFVLYFYTFKDAMYVSILRVFLMGILRTGVFSQTFFFSLMGALLSGTVMYLMKRFSKLSIVGVSIIGSIFHSVGQVLVAIVLLNTINMIYYLPWLLLFSIPTGVIVGTISKELVNYFQKELQSN